MSGEHSSEAPDGGTSDAESLVFQWKRAGNTRWKLAFFLLLSFAAHLLCFYLFQIAYPPSDRTVPTPASITFLSPDVPANRAVLEKIRDRTFHTDPALTGILNALPLDDFSVKFEPSFHDFQFDLKALPSTPTKSDLPRLSKDSGGIVMPPVDSSELTAALADNLPAKSGVGVPVAPVQYRLEADLAQRKVVQKPSWAALPKDAIKTGYLVYLLGISSEGRVSHCLTLASSDPKIEDRLIAVELRDFVFEPMRTDDLQWGRIEIFW